MYWNSKYEAVNNLSLYESEQLNSYFIKFLNYTFVLFLMYKWDLDKLIVS